MTGEGKIARELADQVHAGDLSGASHRLYEEYFATTDAEFKKIAEILAEKTSSDQDSDNDVYCQKDAFGEISAIYVNDRSWLSLSADTRLFDREKTKGAWQLINESIRATQGRPDEKPQRRKGRIVIHPEDSSEGRSERIPKRKKTGG